MSGLGSGRRYDFKKDTTSSYRRLDVRQMQRTGCLEPNLAFRWQWKRNDKPVAFINVKTDFDQVTLDYRHRSAGGEWKSESCPVRIEWTLCHYGGVRAWFLCPGKGCGRRVAILYCGGIFACRHCYQLPYDCQRENAEDRTFRRVDKIRERLGWRPGIAYPCGGKPKGMHWRTFSRLAHEYSVLVKQLLGGVTKRFGLNIET